MKNNLAVFMADAAWHVFGLDRWEKWIPNEKAFGVPGLVLEGDLVSGTDVH